DDAIRALVEVARTVDGGEVPDDFGTRDRALGAVRVGEVAVDKLDIESVEPPSVSAGEVVDDADLVAAREELSDKRGAEEAGATGDDREGTAHAGSSSSQAR